MGMVPELEPEVFWLEDGVADFLPEEEPRLLLLVLGPFSDVSEAVSATPLSVSLRTPEPEGRIEPEGSMLDPEAVVVVGHVVDSTTFSCMLLVVGVKVDVGQERWCCCSDPS